MMPKNDLPPHDTQSLATLYAAGIAAHLMVEPSRTLRATTQAEMQAAGDALIAALKGWLDQFTIDSRDPEARRALRTYFFNKAAPGEGTKLH